MTPTTSPEFTAAQAVRAQARQWVTDDAALAPITIAAGDYRGNIAEHVTAAELAMTVDQVTQLTLTVEDPGFDLLRAGVFARRSLLTYGGAQPGDRTPRPEDVDYGAAAVDVRALESTGARTPRLPTARPLVLELGGYTVGPGSSGRGAVVANYRPRGIQRLKRARQVLAVNGVDPSEVVFLLALRSGLEVVAQRAAKRLQVYTAKGENHWKAVRRWAQELGYLVFESAGVLYFGRPTWLLDRMPTVSIDWADERAGRTAGLVSMPVCGRSENATPPVTVDLELTQALALRLRPGMAIELDGVPRFRGRYLLLEVSGTLGAADTWAAKAATAVDPEPAPPDDPRSADAAAVAAYVKAVQLAAALAYLAALQNAGGTSYGGTYPGNLRAWTLEAIRLTGVPMSWLEPLMARAMQESGGNPRAVNNWDSNAAAGHPSKGLMQTIDSTFAAYHLPGLGDIWNPVHNMCAAIRYIQARYGSVFNLPRGGY